MFSSLPPARRRLVLAAIGLVAVLVVVLGITIFTGDDDAPPVSQATAGPVLLVPGYGGSTDSLTSLAGQLRAAGKDATVVSLPDNAEGDLNQQAETLGQAVTAVRQRTGAATVDIVGYSAGGVVARLWVADHGGGAVARRVVTLGSPQHGTRVADLAGAAVPGACPTACQQLRTDSDVLDDLNDDETPGGATWISIWTTADDVVQPPDSARLDGAINVALQDICPNNRVSHGGLPTDADVTAIVRAELVNGPPVTPTAANCASG